MPNLLVFDLIVSLTMEPIFRCRVFDNKTLERCENSASIDKEAAAVVDTIYIDRDFGDRESETSIALRKCSICSGYLCNPILIVCKCQKQFRVCLACHLGNMRAYHLKGTGFAYISKPFEEEIKTDVYTVYAQKISTRVKTLWKTCVGHNSTISSIESKYHNGDLSLFSCVYCKSPGCICCNPVSFEVEDFSTACWSQCVKCGEHMSTGYTDAKSHIRCHGPRDRDDSDTVKCFYSSLGCEWKGFRGLGEKEHYHRDCSFSKFKHSV